MAEANPAMHQQRDSSFYSNPTIYTTFITSVSIPTPTAFHRTQQTSPSYYSNPNNSDDNDGDDLWSGTKIVASIIPIAVLAAIIIGIWYCCCGGRAKVKQRREARSLPGPYAPQPHPQLPHQAPNQAFTHHPVELTPVPAAHLGDAPPPQYEEALPPRHQTIAGGRRMQHEDAEEEGVIADGKTPLSEIPFEDVVVVSSASSSASGSSARDFGRTHHAGGGNTYGHTNS